MPDPATNYDNPAMENESVVFNDTNPAEADFEAKCKACVLNATENCYIAFDRPAHTGDFLLLADTMITIDEPCEFTKISVLGTTSGTLYIIGRR